MPVWYAAWLLDYFSQHPSVDDTFAAFIGVEAKKSAKAIESADTEVYPLPQMEHRDKIMPNVTPIDSAPAWVREAVRG